MTSIQRLGNQNTKFQRFSKKPNGSETNRWVVGSHAEAFFARRARSVVRMEAMRALMPNAFPFRQGVKGACHIGIVHPSSCPANVSKFC
ncbi:hypothetical protein SJA_C1-23360 [Sphingobium indicum UT26S]|uniref:Uncharacterized protein n=1 Tax=Sphingobium indicum (strain DSM 16413 / CCM 7287 / MTCC 6362 / UT26 / NBRC 101211 / UT26S) TaxID=452662 RepID=D4Z3I8_SPHIU|nr:hypothetical protein SJA_C1-23360 [Sphingobium indicum UT26S]